MDKVDATYATTHIVPKTDDELTALWRARWGEDWVDTSVTDADPFYIWVRAVLADRGLLEHVTTRSDNHAVWGKAVRLRRFP